MLQTTGLSEKTMASVNNDIAKNLKSSATKSFKKLTFEDTMKLGSAIMTTGQMIVQAKQNQGTGVQTVNRRQMRAQKLQRRRV